MSTSQGKCVPRLWTKVKKAKSTVCQNKGKVGLFIILAILFGGLLYSVSKSCYPTKYSNFFGETSIQLDYSYYQIWGDALQVHASFSELYHEKPEPYGGPYSVLLLNTREQPSLSTCEETRTFKGEMHIENGSWVSYNTTVSVRTTPLKEVVTAGDRIVFNVSIVADEDLVFEEWSLRADNSSIGKFHVEKGRSNDIPVAANLTQGDALHKTYLNCLIEAKEGTFNYTRKLSFGYFLVWDIDIYKSIAEEDYFIGSMGHSLLLLPYPCRIVSKQETIVENGKVSVLFPLNESLQADRVIFVRGGHTSIYVLETDPASICLSPPFTLPPAILLMISYAALKKRRVLVLHLSKYRIFYTCILLVIAWVSTASIRAAFLKGLLTTTPSYIIGTVDILLFFCASLIGVISIGVARNGFGKTESRNFWKTSILAMTLPALIFVGRWGYLAVISGDYLDGSNLVFLVLLYFEVPTVLFLSACAVGMISNFLVSHVAGLFLFLVHWCLRLWNRVQHKHAPAPIKVSLHVKARNLKPLRFYASELFLSSIWFLMLLSSSISVNIDRLWDTLFENNTIFFILPLTAFVYLFFLFGTLGATWRNGKKQEKLDSTMFRKVWSIFALLVFITKILYSSTDPEFIATILTIFYFLLIVSLGFAAGFIGTRNIAVRRASREIYRIGKRYAGLQVARCLVPLLCVEVGW